MTVPRNPAAPLSRRELKLWRAFYQNELCANILPFWFPGCIDGENGGFFNCYPNAGANLVSRDKYTWSQGRFVWLLAKLAGMDSLFPAPRRKWFLEQAKQGCDFLARHCLLEGTRNCVFLMSADGTPRLAPGCDALDASVFADCFVAAGFAEYAAIARDAAAWEFAKSLYGSIGRRIDGNAYNSLPYPLSHGYRMHSIPMISTNLACVMHGAAAVMEPALTDALKADIDRASADVLEHFVDGNDCLREIITAGNRFCGGTLGEHINPGHALEDMWFQTEASDILCKPERMSKIARVARRSLELGWDSDYGGLYHFTNLDGGELRTDTSEGAEEPMLRLVLDDWGSKLWWVHIEALYSTLLLYDRTGDDDFWSHYLRLFDYVFRVFPNPDREVREWVQIQTREGRPQDKVVALPVKDPYHIIRGLILLIQLLEDMLTRH